MALIDLINLTFRAMADLTTLTLLPKDSQRALTGWEKTFYFLTIDDTEWELMCY